MTNENQEKLICDKFSENEDKESSN